MITIIDPGHGLTDFGASATHNGELVKEKDLNMVIANRVISQIENYQTAVFTRTYYTQGFISLAQRVEYAASVLSKARGEKARFISIHHNSFTNPAAKGLEVFYKSGCKESETLARVIKYNILQAAFAAGYEYLNRGIKTAPFYVLRNNPVPAVLIECGFMSNPDELAWLTSPVGQITIGYGIAKSLLF